MSFQSAIPWRVALRQSLPPLHRLVTILNNPLCRTMIFQRTATTPLTSCLSPRVHSTIPPHLCALTATDQDAPPQPANATLKDAQLSRVPRNGMVLVVAEHNLAKPCTDRGRTMMLSALKLGLDGFE